MLTQMKRQSTAPQALQTHTKKRHPSRYTRYRPIDYIIHTTLNEVQEVQKNDDITNTYGVTETNSKAMTDADEVKILIEGSTDAE